MVLHVALFSNDEVLLPALFLFDELVDAVGHGFIFEELGFKEVYSGSKI